MSSFVNGRLAEKANIAASLISEILSGMPDDLLDLHQEALSKGAQACHDIHSALRTKDGEIRVAAEMGSRR
jgi:hypothetical protein